MQQGLFVLISGFWQAWTGFCPLLNVCFSDMQISSWLHSSSNLWWIPLCWDLFRKKNRAEKFPFIAANNWTVLAVRWSINYFFTPNSPIIRKSCSEEEAEGEKGNLKRYAFQANAVNVEWSKFALYNVTLKFHA